jgi:hypothetical protein
MWVRAIVAGVAALALALPGGAAAAQTFEVDRTDDPEGPGPTYCSPVPNDCSLRQAAEEANVDLLVDTILLGAGDFHLEDGLFIEAGAVVKGAGARQTVVHLEGSYGISTGLEVTPYEFADLTLMGARNQLGSTYGGAIFQRSPMTLRRVAILDNEDGSHSNEVQLYPAWGGAIESRGNLTIVDSLIAGNRARVEDNGTFAIGAGLHLVGDNTVIRNSTIAQNLAIGNGKPAYGAGIAVNKGSVVTIENSTVAGNVANGSAPSLGSNIYSEAGSTVIVRNSVVADGLPAAVPSCAPSVLSQGGNVEDTTSCFGAGDRSGVDPLLGPLVDNGGPTDTMALLAGSPAIDFGGTCGLATDQRQLPRPAAACDSGAFEFQAGPAKAAACSLKVSGTVAKLEATVTCDAAATLTIEGTATIAPGKPKKATASKKRKKRPKPVTLLPTTTSVTQPGLPSKVGVTLPRSVRKAVKSGKRVSLSLTLTARTAAGATSTTTAQLKKIKKPPRKKRRRGSGSN